MIFRVPQPEVYDHTIWDLKLVTKTLDDYLKVYITPDFRYEIYQDAKAAEAVALWSSAPKKLYWSEFFMLDSGTFATNQLNGKPLLGIGERAGNLFLRDEQGGIHSRYTFDQANPIEDGLPPGKNFYGYQPFYLYQDETSKGWAGVFDVSSYATDYIVNTEVEKGAKTTIDKITIGGMITKFFYQGKKIDDVIKTYQKTVGKPTVPPLWAFGW